MNVPPLQIFQDRSGVAVNACATCHEDVHEGQFGINCAECHHENGFGALQNLTKFDHNRTHFPLNGKHQSVDCRKCHVSDKMTDPLPYNTCSSCHQDYHEGQFVRPTNSPDCAECHSVDGFMGSTFSIEQHAQSAFPLTGAHNATPCLACHLKEEKWRFRQIGIRCADCHQNIHKEQIDNRWFPDQNCVVCHSTSDWQSLHFDHSQTPFALEGAHAKTDCRQCHKPDDLHPQGKFKEVSSRCANCHSDQHFDQFSKNGETNCQDCHSFVTWKIDGFDHNQTRFKLEGKHAKVACESCHQPITQGENTFIRYRFDHFECVVCHQ